MQIIKDPVDNLFDNLFDNNSENSNGKKAEIIKLRLLYLC